MYRIKNNNFEVFLVHPGGPYWKDKNEKTWNIPKGEVKEDEDLFETAKREFEEETGIKIKRKKEDFTYIGEIKQKSGKIVHAWSFEGDWNGLLRQNIITMEFPYKSGKMIKIPEVDKAGFFKEEDAKKKLNSEQFELVERLKKIINY